MLRNDSASGESQCQTITTVPSSIDHRHGTLLVPNANERDRFARFAPLKAQSGMSQIKTAISTPDAPAAIGPYSQAIRVGDTLFTSGQIPLDPTTGEFVAGGITEQTTRVLENLKAVLADAGLDFTHVVKTTVFLKSMGDFAAMNTVYAKYLVPTGAIPPARSTVQVAALPKDALVEIELIAKDLS
jgi:2-iminobutanoate/2-iminopropanoate deaminase